MGSRMDDLYSRDQEIKRLRAENERLKDQIADAELALRVWDDEQSSEYWLRHPDQQRPQESQ